MFGAGVVLVLFGLWAIKVGRSLDGSGCDAFALAGLMPTLTGWALLILGVVFCLFGWAANS